jgi:apolipoprotein N-acyltransferase
MPWHTRLHPAPAALFACGGLTQLFSYGELSQPLAAWLFPVFWLPFVWQGGVSRIVWIAASMLVSFWLQWNSYILAPRAIFGAVSVGYTLAQSLPFMAAYFARRRSIVASASAYVVATVATEALVHRFSPYGSWGSLGYSQAGGTSVLQALALPGGLHALVAWMSAVSGTFAVWLQRTLNVQSSSVATTNRTLVLAASLFFVPFGVGSLRTSAKPGATESILVGGVTVALSDKSIIFSETVTDFGPSFEVSDAHNAFLDVYIKNKTPTSAALPELQAWFDRIQERLLSETRKLADSGAKIVVWSEGNGVVWKDQEARWIQRILELAREKRIYILAAVGVKIPGQYLFENKVIVADPSGRKIGEYFKSRPVPGAENSVPGGTPPFEFDTPWGRMALVICFDADFNHWIRVLDSKRLRALFVPGFDWEAINPYHTQMSGFRAVEGGYPVVRIAETGLSAVFDAKGRLLASRDARHSKVDAFLFELPLESTR